MSDDLTDILEEIIEDAPEGMEIYTRADGEAYEQARKIHNTRLDRRPFLVAVCRKPDHYAYWFEAVAGLGTKLSIKSGGHQHEAMCSNTGGVVMLADPDYDVEFVDDDTHLWLGPGQHLGDVIDELAGKRLILPTGGCRSVCVGGLTSGGGWGMSYRTLGATVDMLREVQMVLPNCDWVHFNNREWLAGTSTTLPVTPTDLFWAVSGGGGGNFGAVTRFKFELTPFPDWYCEFTFHWIDEDLEDAAVAWMELCREGDHRLNMFARMTVLDTPEVYDENNPPFMVVGRFYGTREEAENALQDLIGQYKPVYEDWGDGAMDPHRLTSLMFPGTGNVPIGNSGNPLPPQAYALQVGSRGKHGPEETCKIPEPHKVSSAIPAGGDRAVAEALHKYVRQDHERDGVNTYVSLHGMGGKPADLPVDHNAFPWRKRAYIIQSQAWWNHKNLRGDQGKIVEWVSGLGTALGGLADGAFINFPDVSQEVDYYYGTALTRLQQIKDQVDEDNVLEFPLGLGPKSE